MALLVTNAIAGLGACSTTSNMARAARPLTRGGGRDNNETVRIGDSKCMQSKRLSGQFRKSEQFPFVRALC